MNTQPSYKTNDPKGFCGDPKRGAAMGRYSIHTVSQDGGIDTHPVKLTLRRIRLNSGGYDVNGTYFGIGGPLYWYANAEGTIDAMLRAANRSAAKAEIRKRYPNARFHN